MNTDEHRFCFEPQNHHATRLRHRLNGLEVAFSPQQFICHQYLCLSVFICGKNLKRRGFSLLEIMAVILLISIFAAAVRGPVVNMLDSMTARNAIDQIKTIDRQLRQEATRSGQVGLLHIDPLEGTLTRTDSSAEQVPIGQPIQLAKNIRIEQIRIAPQRDNFDELNAVFQCSPNGVTRTYALEVQTPSRTTWLLFAGLTGQCYEFQSEDDLAQVLDELSRPWSELN